MPENLRQRCLVDGELAAADTAAVAQIVADTLAAVLGTPRPKLRYVVGKDARAALVMRKLLPWSLFERIIVKSAGLG